MRKRILITGASGFVGRNVKEYLEQTEKYEIYAPTSSELNCLDEQAVVSCLKQYNFDYVLHFAVYGDAIDKKRMEVKHWNIIFGSILILPAMRICLEGCTTRDRERSMISGIRFAVSLRRK